MNDYAISLQVLDEKLSEPGPNSGMWLYQNGRGQGKQNKAVIDQVIVCLPQQRASGP